MSKQFMLSVAIVLGLFTVGCASTGDKNVPVPTTTSSTDSGYETSGVADTHNQGSALSGGPEDTSGLDLSKRTIFFEFDSSDINPTGQQIIGRFAQHLMENPTARLRLEGHADERGTREYNIGLGERRANAVKAALTRKGVAPSQLSVVSYGEERPAVGGHSESDWAQNRRVEIVQL